MGKVRVWKEGQRWWCEWPSPFEGTLHGRSFVTWDLAIRYALIRVKVTALLEATNNYDG